MNKLFAAILTVTLVTPSAPAYALRGQEAAQTGLEEQLRDALQSPADLVHTAQNFASRTLGLNPAPLTAGLEERVVVDQVSGAILDSVRRSPDGRLYGRDALSSRLALLDETTMQIGLSQRTPRDLVLQIVTEGVRIGGPNEVYEVVHIPSEQIVLIRPAGGLEERQVWVRDAQPVSTLPSTDGPGDHPMVRMMPAWAGAADAFVVAFRDPLETSPYFYFLVQVMDDKATTLRFFQQSKFTWRDIPDGAVALNRGATPVAPESVADGLTFSIEDSLLTIRWDAAKFRGLQKVAIYYYKKAPAGLTSELDEGIQIKTAADLLELGDANAAELAQRLVRERKPGVVLLPKDEVDSEEVARQERQVALYAHLTVAGETLTLLPLEWNFKGRLYELDEDPVVANEQLKAANDAAEAGRAVIIGLDAGQKIDALNLFDVRGAKVRLKPGTVLQLNDQLKQIHAFLRRPETLTNVILDLTSGTVRTEKIRGRERYALDIAA